MAAFSNKQNPVLIQKLQNYEKEAAKYYLVYSNTVPLFFFSLQASCVFQEPYTPSDELLDAAKRIADKLPIVPFRSKRDILISAYEGNSEKLIRVDQLDERDIDYEVKKIVTAINYLSEQNDPDTSDLSVYDSVIPAVELVEFCKCDLKDSTEIWERLRKQWNDDSVHTAGEYVFFTHIFPIVLRVSREIGCRLLLLYAADSSDNETLIQYYVSRLHLSKPGSNVVVNKPLYDIGCKLLTQDISELKSVYEALIPVFEHETQPA